MKKNRRRVLLVISWAAVILWMGCIFKLSSQDAQKSSDLSMTVTKTIIKAVGDEGEYTVSAEKHFNHIVRKNAHFFSYLLLALLLMNAVRRSRIDGMRAIGLSFLIAVLYAVSDEFHQMFVMGRGPGVKDVIIDSLGALLGIMLFCSVIKVKSFIVKNVGD